MRWRVTVLGAGVGAAMIIAALSLDHITTPTPRGLALPAPGATTRDLATGGEYARFRFRAAALARNDRLLAAFPRYPGVRQARHVVYASEYKVGDSEYVWAAPYRTHVSYVLRGVPGSSVLRFFERRLSATTWRCRFFPRANGGLRAIECRRGHASIGGTINDAGGYGLYAEADERIPPIRTVPGD
jgi:hypothetical protein